MSYMLSNWPVNSTEITLLSSIPIASGIQITIRLFGEDVCFDNTVAYSVLIYIKETN